MTEALSTKLARMRTEGALAALVVAMLVLMWPAPAHGQEPSSLRKKLEEQRKELERIQKEIELHRKKSGELKTKERNLLKAISSLEKEAALSEKLLRSAKKQQELLEERIDSLRVRIVIEEEKLSFQKERLEKRLRELYMQEPNLTWAVLLGSSDLQEMLRRQKFLRLVAERDAHLFEEVRKNKLALERERAELTESLVDVAALQKMREKEAASLKRSRDERRAMLKKIKRERGRHEQALSDLEKAKERLSKLLEEMERKRLAGKGITGVGDFAALKGKLIWPVKGKVVKRFGKNRHPKFGTVTFNSGIDIAASIGAPIRAVADGVVEFVDWIEGYGQCIIINQGRGYYTLYSHVSEVLVREGQRVAGGEVIAEVGETGSIEGPVCHFEIRKSRQALDPLDWIAR